MKVFSFICFCASLAYCGYYFKDYFDDPEIVEVDPPIVEQVYRYPDMVTLKNRNGAEVEVILIGRSETAVQFKRQSDSKSFIYKLSELDDATRALLEKYPETEVTLSEASANKPLSLDEVQVEALKDSIRKLNANLAYMDRELRKDIDGIEKRSIQLDMEEIMAERSVLEAKLSAYGVNPKDIGL